MTSALPNVLTVLRLVAVPVMVAMLFADDGVHGVYRWAALALFASAAATDFLDGYLARRWEVVSDFGKLADPIADKALVLAALAMLSVVDGLPWWPLALVAFREVYVTVGRLMVAGDVVIPASPGGKLKTFLQVLAIGLLMWPGAPGWLLAVGWWTLVVSTLIAVATGVDYAVRIARARRADPPQKGERRVPEAGAGGFQP